MLNLCLSDTSREMIRRRGVSAYTDRHVDTSLPSSSCRSLIPFSVSQLWRSRSQRPDFCRPPGQYLPRQAGYLTSSPHIALAESKHQWSTCSRAVTSPSTPPARSSTPLSRFCLAKRSSRRRASSSSSRVDLRLATVCGPLESVYCPAP